MVSGRSGGYSRTYLRSSLPVVMPLSLFTQMSTEMPERRWSNLTMGTLALRMTCSNRGVGCRVRGGTGVG